MPIYTPDSTNVAIQPSNTATKSTGTATQYTTASTPTTHQLLSANSSRTSFIIKNNSGTDLHIGFIAPTGTAPQLGTIVLPGNSTYIDDTDWLGAVFGWRQNSGTIAVELVEFT